RGNGNGATSMEGKNVLPPPNPNGPTPAQIAAAAHAAALQVGGSSEVADDVARATLDGVDATAEEVGAGEQERAPRTAAEPAAAPQPERVPTPEPDPQPEPEPDPQPEPEPEPRPKRRRRGRVVAPAGPPTGGAE